MSCSIFPPSTDDACTYDRIVLIFFFSSLSALYSLYTLVPFALARRALYYRERASYTYSVGAYTWAEGLIEVPYLLIQILLTCPIIYYMTDLPTDRWERPFFFVLLITELLLLMTSLVTHLLRSSRPSVCCSR